DEAAAYPPDKAALKICYATAGESLWDIARRCRTSVEAVMEENHLTGDTLPADTMLLIPLC
ncbi:MAG: LysM peptidoglycan-binding domain-containing protein, partial [Clostridia bacterium]|nr:LysM peptidoglycan-binding domain-containing protein [Clostridia bacterium]